MEINFAYLKNDPLLKNVYPAAARISKLYQIADYRDTIANSRLLIETIVKQIFVWENLSSVYSLPDHEQRNLRNNLQYLRQQLDYPQLIFDLLNEVRRMGNDAVHDANYHFTKNQAWHCLLDVNDLIVFLLNSYEDKKLNYLRPDILMAAATSNLFKQRKSSFIHIPTKKAVENNDVIQAKKLISKKKKQHFLRLRKFLRH